MEEAHDTSSSEGDQTSQSSVEESANESPDQELSDKDPPLTTAGDSSGVQSRSTEKSDENQSTEDQGLSEDDDNICILHVVFIAEYHSCS
jgi:hypothetical protein